MSFLTHRRSCRIFSLEFRCAQVQHVQAHDDLGRLATPATSRRPRDSEIRGDGHVPAVSDEISKPMVVTPLRAPRGHHGG